MIGEQIENYKIQAKLGEGAMGVVYKAMDLNLERVVALKLMNAGLSHHPDLEARFRAEARTQATLNHQNIATLYSFLTWEGKAVMVMEYVDGKTLQQMVAERGALPPVTALALCKQALYGVGAAHRQNIVHRDLKPANLMLSNNGVIKVMDFGIAKIKGGAGLKGTAMAIGTYDYMAPEQALNQHVDGRSDIYSMGITLYELLTGDVPFTGTSELAVQMAHLNERPRDPRERNPLVPESVAEVVLKALEKNPDDRFATTEDFIRALPRLSDASGQIPRQTTPARGTAIDTGGFSGAQPPAAEVRQPSWPPMPPAVPPTVVQPLPPPVQPSAFAPGQQVRSDQSVLNPAHVNPAYATPGPVVVPPRPQFVRAQKKSNMGAVYGGAAVLAVALVLAAAWAYFKPKPVMVVPVPAPKENATNGPQPVNPTDPKNGAGTALPPKGGPHAQPDKPGADKHGPYTNPQPEPKPEPPPYVPPPKVDDTPSGTGLVGAWKGTYLDSATQQTTDVEVMFQGSDEHLTGKASFTLPDQTTGQCSVSSSKYDPATQVLILSYTSCTGGKAPDYLHSTTRFGGVESTARRLKDGKVYGMKNVNAVFAKHGV